jgi:hypothetical protein
MTVKALLEMLQHGLVVRLAVALGTLGNFTVLWMALGTIDFTVLALCMLPFTVYTGMARGTGRCIALAVFNLQGFVHRMARFACCKVLVRYMRLMALEACGNLPMALVTSCATHFCMFARILFQFSGRTRMTLAAL